MSLLADSTAENSIAEIPRQTAGTPEARADSGHRAYFVSPMVDFFCLGGGSLIVLPLIALLLPAESSMPAVTLVMLLLTNVINHPHFAHSYQIFYRNFRRKAFGGETPPALRRRYIFAGIVAPALLFVFFAVSVAQPDARMLGLGMNLMGFLVGWHYIKQGYGMAIVDSVFKRLFYSDQTKKLMLVNGYACWMLGWMLANREVSERNVWGISAHSIEIPDPLFYAVAGCAAVTSALALFALFTAWRKNGGKIAINGVIAYLTTLYLWIVFIKINPLFILIVPAFHSLQYLLVVWRFQLNLEHDQPQAREYPRRKWLGRLTPTNATTRFTLFVATGTALGAVCFWIIPLLFSAIGTYDREVFGGTLFFFICWIFINIHHYFLDNVMWRRENPDTKKHLFS